MNAFPSSGSKVGKKHRNFPGKEKTDETFVDETVRTIASTLTIPRRSTKRPLLIAMTGLLGSGCSSVAKELAKTVGAAVLRSDELRAVYLRPRKKEYQAHTLPILHGLARFVFERGGNVILDRDDVEGRTKEYFRDLVKEFRAKVITIRVVADRDVIIQRLVNAVYNPQRTILVNRVVALREMTRRIPLHYDWIPKPVPQFVLKKNLSVKPFATLDTSDGKRWKNEVKNLSRRLNVL